MNPKKNAFLPEDPTEELPIIVIKLQISLFCHRKGEASKRNYAMLKELEGINHEQ